jgi:hypothetical protein
MTNNNLSSEPKPVKDLSQRTLKKIGEIDIQVCKPNNAKEIDFFYIQKTKIRKNDKFIWATTLSN